MNPREPGAVRRTARREVPAGLARGWSWVLVHPVFWVSAVVLVVNDRVLKWSFPGLVTGKLSDVAGVVMVALVLVALSGLVRVSLVVTAVLFALLKTVPVVAVWAVPVLGGRTLTDPTDVLAVVALVPLGWWLLSRRELVEAGGGVEDRVGARAWRTAAKIGGVFFAVLATSATSCSANAFEALTVTPEGSIIAGSVEHYGEQERLMLPVKGSDSNDHGDYQAWVYDIDADEVDLLPNETRACANDGVCAEIRGVSIVEVGSDGTERVIVDVTDELDAINSQVGGCYSGLDGAFPDVVSNGEVIVVAMGPLGAMVRTADGEWLPTGSGSASLSLADTAPTEQLVEQITIFVPLIAAIIGAIFLLIYRTRWWARLTGILLGFLGWVGYLFVWIMWVGLFEGAPAGTIVLAVVGSTLILVACVVLAMLGRRTRRAPTPSPGWYYPPPGR